MEHDARDGLDDVRRFDAYVLSIRLANMLQELEMVDNSEANHLSNSIWRYMDEND